MMYIITLYNNLNTYKNVIESRTNDRLEEEVLIE